MKRILIIAGETSGDMHGAALMHALNNREPGIAYRGIGGKRMIDEGLDPLRLVGDMQFMGFAEVLRHLPFIRRTMRDCEEIVREWNPDLVILIDYPGFNLRFARRAKKHGVPVLYYISPQLWAWHTSRVKQVRRYVDRMVVILPFERDFYRTHDVDVTYVGHPLVETVEPSMDREVFLAAHDIPADNRLVGFVPGSRPQEIQRILPAMVASFSILSERIGDLSGIVACAPDIDGTVYDGYCAGSQLTRTTGQTYDVMAHADVLVVTSGTATLEAGILETPMCIVYKTSPLTYAIARMLVSIHSIGLINIVAGERIVPELRQGEVTGERIAEETGHLLLDRTAREEMKKRLSETRSTLGGPGAAGRAADVVLEMLEQT